MTQKDFEKRLKKLKKDYADFTGKENKVDKTCIMVSMTDMLTLFLPTKASLLSGVMI